MGNGRETVRKGPMAERVGFEPTVRSPAHRISSAAHSTTLPPLRIGASKAPGAWSKEAARVAEGRGLANPVFRLRGAFSGDAPSVFIVALPRRTYLLAMSDRSIFFSPTAGRSVDAPMRNVARYSIGDVLRHRMFDFRGVVFDVDPVFANSDDWYESIPENLRPKKDQPFYHLLAENDESSYVAYVSQQNLVFDGDSGPVDHPNVAEIFEEFTGSKYRLRRSMTH